VIAGNEEIGIWSEIVHPFYIHDLLLRFWEPWLKNNSAVSVNAN
jgi:hypothetical protein